MQSENEFLIPTPGYLEEKIKANSSIITKLSVVNHGGIDKLNQIHRKRF